MKSLSPEKPAWLAAALRVIFLVIIVLLLLPLLTPVQSACPSEGPLTPLPVASEVKTGNLVIPGPRSAVLDRENPARRLAGLAVASPPAPGSQQDVTVRPAILGRLPRRCPLPPASAFHVQTNLRKYLENWPAPGSTVSEDWAAYVPEDGENVE
jgi:hypothetical protein